MPRYQIENNQVASKQHDKVMSGDSSCCCRPPDHAASDVEQLEDEMCSELAEQADKINLKLAE